MIELISLYMDDVRELPNGWVIARTVEEAMTLLMSGKVQRCSLDHDMGACKSCIAKGLDVGNMQTDETTFMHWCPHVLDGTKLVNWMIVSGYWPLEKPVVHSANPNGRDRMRGLIDRYWPQRVDVWPEYPERKVIMREGENG